MISVLIHTRIREGIHGISIPLLPIQSLVLILIVTTHNDSLPDGVNSSIQILIAWPDIQRSSLESTLSHLNSIIDIAAENELYTATSPLVPLDDNLQNDDR